MFEFVESLHIDGERATGLAHVPADHPALRDHFAGRQILPGTWLVELAAQIAGPLAESATQARHGLDRCALLAIIEHAKLLSPVELPANVRFEAEVMRSEPSTARIRVSANRVTCVLRAELVFALVDAPPGTEDAVRERLERQARWRGAP